MPSAKDAEKDIYAEQNDMHIARADELAKQLFDRKRFAEAAHIAEAVVGLSNRNPGALANAARCHIYASDPYRAEELLLEMRESDMRQLGDRTDLELMVLALGWQGRHDEAEAITKKFPDSIQRSFNLGWQTMRHGNFKEAFPLLEQGRSSGIWGDNEFTSPMPQWDGASDLNGRMVLLNLERGLGDHIIQARHARDLTARGAFVIVRTHPSLVMMLGQMEGAGQVVSSMTALPVHELWVPGMSASMLLGIDKPNGTPYLKQVPWSLAHWTTRLGEKTRPRIGIRWQGNPMFEHEQQRVLPADVLADALRDLGDLYSFQRDTGSEICPSGVIDLSKELVTWEDTCAALSCMDVLVTSCTSVTHAAAAMGVKTVVITPIMPYYPWTDETALPRSQWYDSVLISRQTRIRQWDDAIVTAAEHVKTFLSL